MNIYVKIAQELNQNNLALFNQFLNNIINTKLRPFLNSAHSLDEQSFNEYLKDMDNEFAKGHIYLEGMKEEIENGANYLNQLDQFNKFFSALGSAVSPNKWRDLVPVINNAYSVIQSLKIMSRNKLQQLKQ